MTARYLDLNLIWASDGSAIDPDLDTTSPIYQPNKFVKGWIVEKEPSQWQNYLYQITDQKNLIAATEQFIEWESDISYAKNSITVRNGVTYLQASNAVALNKDPATQTAIWLPLLGLDAATVTAAVATLTKTLSDHLAASNPHNDNIHQIGGYESGEIDLMLGDPTDPRTIIYHEAQIGKVHSETPAQVGTLPVSGGTFKGDVNFNGGLTLTTYAFVGVDGDDVTMKNAKGAITLQQDGTGVYVVLANGVRAPITTVDNFVSQQNAVNNLFALPQPLMYLDVRLNLTHLGCSSQTVTTTADPVFEAGGMTFDTFKTLSVDGANFTNVPTTCYIVGWDGTQQVYQVFNSSQSNWNSLGNYMSTRLTGFTHVQYVYLFPALTSAQLSTLKR